MCSVVLYLRKKYKSRNHHLDIHFPPPPPPPAVGGILHGAPGGDPGGDPGGSGGLRNSSPSFMRPKRSSTTKKTATRMAMVIAKQSATHVRMNTRPAEVFFAEPPILKLEPELSSAWFFGMAVMALMAAPPQPALSIRPLQTRMQQRVCSPR